MFAYEGLGSIYWHMVSKLMLAVQEIALENTESDSLELVAAYYDVQNGLGFRRELLTMGRSLLMRTHIRHLCRSSTAWINRYG